MLFAPDGSCLGVEQRDLIQHYPRDGWVEHDPAEIWRSSLACARAMAELAGGGDRPAPLVHEDFGDIWRVAADGTTTRMRIDR